jgi:PhoPQ-activated pathogenicity-related protein
MALAVAIVPLTIMARANDAPAQRCFENRGSRFNEVLACYRAAEASQPLAYAAKDVTRLPGLQKRRFELISQSWPQNGIASPVSWKHDVDIYIPDDALTGRAILISNNGINIPSDNNGARPSSDFTEATSMTIALKTKTIVISVGNNPNQYLTYADDGIARREDSSVAHSWALFMQAPDRRPFMSLHVPMMEAMVKTMDLAEKELQPWKIHSFIATGTSKRAWGAWLAAIADTRIEAIVPFVIDVLGTGKVLDHTYRTYGGNWPLAFMDYHREGITTQRKTEKFDKLMRIEDPLRYLGSAYARRLAIPKYIVNASGDDFFVPDNARFYFDQLPGAKALRVAPNSDHYGVRDYVENSLITFTNRLQNSIALPTLTMQWTENVVKGGRIDNVMRLGFSETPVEIVQWVAANPLARDFRYACGIRYEAIPISPGENVTVSMTTPDKGWKSSFVEAKFADGLVVTTPARVFSDIYPAAPPPALGSACRTIADSAIHAPSLSQDANVHATFTWRAWADSEYLADRDAGIDAARLCTRAKGQVVGQESLGTRMLGNGTWHATTRVTCLMDQQAAPAAA